MIFKNNKSRLKFEKAMVVLWGVIGVINLIVGNFPTAALFFTVAILYLRRVMKAHG